MMKKATIWKVNTTYYMNLNFIHDTRYSNSLDELKHLALDCGVDKENIILDIKNN